MIKVKLVRGYIGCSPKQRKTLQALGLRKIRAEKSFEDTAAVRGMIAQVEHMVEVTKQ